jgi:pyruvate,water dikinase
MASYTSNFGDADATRLDLTGGKGANLAKLTQAGFTVPPGFIVGTHAYRDFVAHNGLDEALRAALLRIHYADAEDVDAKTEAIRASIVAGEIPAAIRAEIVAGYRALGADAFVAVRSSGTAEDLAETSFAGQHDTYLDVLGEEKLLERVRRCWASMWTARATAYRQQHGIDQGKIGIAVVVQVMISSEVSGVLFTANPMTGAVDEMVVNAAWGLGEGIVSGILTPDQFVLARDTLAVKSTELGSKQIRVVRDRTAGSGVVHETVAPADCARATLTPAELRVLGKLGRAVQTYYGEFPQDIEWAYADGRFYLLQSRDVTGIEFSWDEDLEDWDGALAEEPDTVWTRVWADAVWPGAVTPLFYSIRCEMLTRMHVAAETLWGFDDVAKMRMFKYHKGRVYYNSKIDYGNIAKTLPPDFRKPEILAHMPKDWHQKIIGEPWSWAAPLKLLARLNLLDPSHSPYATFRSIYDTIKNRVPEGDGLPVEEIRALSDKELKRYVQSRIMYQKEWVEDLWSPFFLYLPMAMSLFGWMLENWYDGDNKWISSDLITGLSKPTITLLENHELWKLSELIRQSPVLRGLFEQHEGSAFFDAIQGLPEAKEFLDGYAAFLVEFGHRGHSDRDIYGDRRIENPAIDYANLRALLTADSASPEESAKALIARRLAATEEVVASIRRQPPLAALKVEAFHTVHGWLLQFFAMRDDERHYTDRVTFSKKRAICEVGRRLNERGLLSGDDFYFLSKVELFELLDRGRTDRVALAKVTGRRRNFLRADKEFKAPIYIQGGKYVDLDGEKASGASDGALRGIGTSRGEVTGIARIIATQKEIGQVRKGDILITSATDPGWTPVFLVISGLVLETGGMLAHGSCISREYGIPAVQIPDAMKHIKDGSTISVNGDTGEVRILAEPGETFVPAGAETILQ